MQLFLPYFVKIIKNKKTTLNLSLQENDDYYFLDKLEEWFNKLLENKIALQPSNKNCHILFRRM